MSLHNQFNRLGCDTRSLTLGIFRGFRIGTFSDLYRLEDPDTFAWRSPSQVKMEMMDEVIGNVVCQLPTLKHLQLGQYNFKSKHPQHNDEWGTAVRWQKIVRRRSAREFTRRPIEEIISEEDMEVQKDEEASVDGVNLSNKTEMQERRPNRVLKMKS